MATERENADIAVLQVIHPACASAVILDSLVVEALTGAVLVDGLCLTCQRYVHLRVEPPVRRTVRPVVTMRQAQQKAVEDALAHTGGNMRRAAKTLGITHTTMYRWAGRCR